jgi:YVTN family beta-propeller protein
MKTSSTFIFLFLWVNGFCRSQDNLYFHPIKTISLATVEGRIDHLAMDLKRHRLFVAALGNNSVEVIDLASGKVIRSISELQEPQGLAYVSEFDKLFVASGGDGTCKIFDGNSLNLVGIVNFGSDADNIRYDAVGKKIYVGFGEGGIGVIHAETGVKTATIGGLPGHPEAFELTSSDIFVNVPSAKRVCVIDRKTNSVRDSWFLEKSENNFPMALDDPGHYLFIGTRGPSQLQVMDEVSGKIITQLNSDGDPDDLFYDAGSKRIYMTCGAGFIDVFQQNDADRYHLLFSVSTSPGARTGLLVAEQDRFYLAVPRRGDQNAEIRVFSTEAKR